MTDNGMQYTSLGGPRQAGHISVDPQGRLYVSADQGERGGLWRYDPGLSKEMAWTRLLDEHWIMNCAVDPVDPKRVAIATNQNPYTEVSQATGVWLSADEGRSWSQQNDALPMTRGWAIAIDPHDHEQVVFGSNGRGFWTCHWPTKFVPTSTRRYKSTAEDAAFAQPLIEGADGQ